MNNLDSDTISNTYECRHSYMDIYNQFLEKTNIDEKLIMDYKPCFSMYNVPYIKDGLIIWLKSGGKIIYIFDHDYQYL